MWENCQRLEKSLVMTRIIQRCFLILAFTGIFLSTAQQTTLSDASLHSTSSPKLDGPSSWESSTASAGQLTSSATVDATEDGSSSRPSSSNSDVAGGTPSEIGAGSESEHVTQEPVVTEHDRESESPPSVSHSSGLYEIELHVSDSSETEKSSTSDKAVVTGSEDVVLASKGRGTHEVTTDHPDDKTPSADSKTTETYVSEFAKDEASTKPVAASQPTSPSRKSSVPSTEESVYSPSSVDRTQSPEMMMTSSPTSKVQTEESATGDSAKSGTRKRSLNATNSMTSSTTVMGSSTPAVALSKDILPPTSEAAERVHDNDSAEILTTTREPASLKVEDGVIISKSIAESEVTSFPQAINSAELNPEASKADLRESEPVTELASSESRHDVSPISSAALSTSSEDSIHPFATIHTTAQITNERSGGISTASQGSPGLESEESEFATSQSYPRVTFDPDGMTHNSSQDPDSVTFSRGIFRVDGHPGEGLLSRLEHEESQEHRHPESGDVRLAEGTTDPPELLGNGSLDDSAPFHREREPMSPSGHALLPHEEPDFEEMSSKSPAPSTRSPEVVKTANGSLDFNSSGKVVFPANDESEEMLNDSPHFVQVQSKPATTPSSKPKTGFATEDLEAESGNGIVTPTVGANTQADRELDFATEYRSEQSEIRPVTASSPFRMSESPTVRPALVETLPSSPGPANPGQAISPETSSPIILSNPAPTDASQTAETSVVLHPVPAARSNASDVENDTAANTSSTIAGVAVRTSVSVSLPLSNTPNDTTISHAIQVVGEANVSSNASEVILPLPIPVIKDADGHPAPTEAPSPLTTESSGLRIRKPKLKLNGDDDSEPATPRTRKPFITPYQKASTTAGPPVSIFKKARTRMASITSSTTARPFRQFSTIRIHYASRMPGMVPGVELVFSTEPITTTVPTTTETEEPFSDEPFTEQTIGPIVPSEDDVTLLKVAGYIALEKGLRWNDQLISRFTPQYKEKANFLQIQLDRLFRTSPIASQLWKIQIDGFSVVKNTKSVAVDFMMYLIKTPNAISMQQLIVVFHDKLKNNTFSRFTVDTNRTSFELLSSEPMKPTTEPPEEEPEPVIPQWAIAVIVVGAASLIFIVLFAAVAILGRHHMRRRYSSKLNDEDSDRPSDWESKMAAAYENLAADTIYDAEDLHSDTYKKSYLVD